MQRLGWATDRVAWVVLAALGVLALLGLFGGGPLGARTISHPSGLSLTYDRFGRKGADVVLTFSVPPRALDGGRAEIWLSSNYLDGVKVDQITPMPDQVTPSKSGLLFSFLAGRSMRTPLQVTFDLTADEVGRHLGSFSSGSRGEAIDFQHFFYP